MNSYAVSLVRTWVPILVGSLISWTASFGFHVGNGTRRSLMVWMTGLLIGAYYTAVRSLEQRYPKLGILLGTQQQPSYPAPVPPVAPVVSLSLQASPPVHTPTDPPTTLEPPSAE